MAKRAVPSFPHLTSEERDNLAAILDSLFRAVDMFFEGVERTPYIAAWNQAPAKSPDDGRLHLQLFSLMRSPGRMKYLAGSESGMGFGLATPPPNQLPVKCDNYTFPISARRLRIDEPWPACALAQNGPLAFHEPRAAAGFPILKPLPERPVPLPLQQAAE